MKLGNGVTTTVEITERNPYYKVAVSEEARLKELGENIENLGEQSAQISEICGSEYAAEVEEEIKMNQAKVKMIIEMSCIDKAAAFQVKINEIMELAAKSPEKIEITFGFHDENNKKIPLMIIRIGRTEIRCIKDRATEANMEDLNTGFYTYVTKAIIKKVIDIFNN
jgi:hypothetical protein